MLRELLSSIRSCCIPSVGGMGIRYLDCQPNRVHRMGIRMARSIHVGSSVPLTTSGPEKGATLGIESPSIWQVPRQQTNRMRTRTRWHLLHFERQSFGKELRRKQPYGNMTYNGFFISVVPRSLPFNYATTACQPESPAGCLSQTPPVKFIFR